jgi:adenosine deaminase
LPEDQLRFRFASIVIALAALRLLGAQSAPARGAAPNSSKAAAHAFKNTERAYDHAVKQGPTGLRVFLARFPKGGDLHVHLTGAVYAETFIRDAGEDGLCVDAATSSDVAGAAEDLRFAKPPCTPPLTPANDLSGNLNAARQALYDRLVDAFSMRGFVPTPGWSGHDQFFATFSRFGGLDARHLGEWVDEVARLAAAQNQQYLELMETPPFAHAAALARQIGWNPDLAQLRTRLLEAGLRDEVATDRSEIQRQIATRRRLEDCGSMGASPACAVEVRFLYQVLRGFAPEQVFAQALLGFETVERSIRERGDDWVGINLVMPEDGYVAMRDYTLQMRMFGYLHSVYPDVPIALHAGELAPGLVPPAGLRFHVRQAVEIGHADRIGHGVDVAYENDPAGLMKEMAARHVLVEINLTSNDVILGVRGPQHPLPLYREAGVPVALSTDDEGVSRIDITHEYVRAALDYRLGYGALKRMVRASLEHAFLPGPSLWAAPDSFVTPIEPCAGQALGGRAPSQRCRAFLDGSEKAAAQWELERRFRAFERQW